MSYTHVRPRVDSYRDNARCALRWILTRTRVSLPSAARDNSKVVVRDVAAAVLHNVGLEASVPQILHPPLLQDATRHSPKLARPIESDEAQQYALLVLSSAAPSPPNSAHLGDANQHSERAPIGVLYAAPSSDVRAAEAERLEILYVAVPAARRNAAERDGGEGRREREGTAQDLPRSKL